MPSTINSTNHTNTINTADTSIIKRNFAVIEQIGSSIMVICYTISPDTKQDILQQDYIKMDQTCVNPSKDGVAISFSSQGDIEIDENPSLPQSKDGCYKTTDTKKIFIKLVDPSKELSNAELSSINYIGRTDFFHFWNLGFNSKNVEISMDCCGVDFKLIDVSQFRPIIMTVYL